jgi:hypothetical protein
VIAQLPALRLLLLPLPAWLLPRPACSSLQRWRSSCDSGPAQALQRPGLQCAQGTRRQRPALTSPPRPSPCRSGASQPTSSASSSGSRSCST